MTRLLVATKKLLESLTQWAKHIATENDVSDSYVNLGNEFKVSCRAFTNAGVDVSDLGDVPHSLRLVLEETLCEEPSQESLDRFLPQIREIIVDLLQNLKKKQAAVKQLQGQNQVQSQSQQTRSVSGPATVPGSAHSASSSVSATPSLPESLVVPDIEVSDPVEKVVSTVKEPIVSSPKPRHSSDALAQLQNGDSLRRRASKRFSAYQYAKLTNFTPEKDSELPVKKLLESKNSSPLINNNNNSKGGFDIPLEAPDSMQVYLKIGQRVKKVTLKGTLSTASLRLLFVEKFAYSPGTESFPDIYIQDPNSNVSYELEELTDIQDQTVISLNELSTPDDGLKSLELKFNSLVSQISDLKETMVKSLDEINSKPAPVALLAPEAPVAPVAAPEVVESSLKSPIDSVDLKELDEIKRDLAVIRQVTSKNKNYFTDSISEMTELLESLKEAGYEASQSANRTYMESCRDKLSKDCEGLLTKTDDLQDIIEAIRKDVAQRRARPPKKQLNFVAKELQNSKLQLKAVNDYITEEKQNWKKIWEGELNTVCEEQQFFNLQEELVMDLQDDLDKAFETFELVEECSDQFSKNPNMKVLPNLPIPGPNESLSDMRDALLSEVVALNPNHEGRVAAIAKAERLREMQKEISLTDNFQEELNGFVQDNKLKKSGGIEETERLRELQNQENLKSLG